MPYRLTYFVNVDWVGAGEGPMGGGLVGAGVTTTQGPSSGGALPEGGRGGAQTLGIANGAGGQSIVGSGTGGILLSADITTLLTGMTTDLSAQMNAAATLAKLQGFATGGG